MGHERRISIIVPLWLVVFLVSALPITTQAGVPMLINYQGYLTDESGTPLSGRQQVNFHLYSAETGGFLLWEEEQLVEVTDGIFNVQLGTVNPILPSVFKRDTIYLEIEIFDADSGWETLTPRQQFTSTAFAVRAGNADMLEGYTLSELDDDYVNIGEADAITSTMIVDSSIEADDLAANSVGTAEISTAAVATAKLADNAVTTEKLADNAVTSNKLANGTVTSAKIADDSITAADMQDGATLSEIIDDDGADSGLDADFLDGLNASDFSSASHNHDTLYVNKTGDSMSGSTAGSVLSVTNAGTGYGIQGSSSGSGGRGVYGWAQGSSGIGVYGTATNTGDVENYGGYFESEGRYGAGILGKATHSYGGKGVYGEAMGDAGIGVYGLNHGLINAAVMARSDHDSGGQAIWGIAEGSSGKGVMGQATNTGDAHNYGGYFSAEGKYGIGVYGEATADSIFGFENSGGYFVSAGKYGTGVYGSASDIGGKGVFGEATYTTGIDYGGYFKAAGSDGRGVYAEATGARGLGIYARATGGGKAAYFEGDIDVKGNITREYVEGSSNPAVPLAYAFINSDGTIASGTLNISAHWNASSSQYEITISGESYFFSDYVTVVTPAGGPFTVGTSSISGKLIVFIYNLSGTKVQGSFQFITYKP